MNRNQRFRGYDGTKCDYSILGELGSVRQQVQESLLDAHLVAAKTANVIGAEKFQLVAIHPHQCLRLLHDFGQHIRQVELRDTEVHLSRVDLTQIQQVIDQQSKVFGCRQDFVQVLQELLLPESVQFLAQKLRVANNNAKRGTKFMRDVREKVPFRDICYFSGFLCNPEFLISLSDQVLSLMLSSPVPRDLGITLQVSICVAWRGRYA